MTATTITRPAVRSTRPATCCPIHNGRELQGGPVQYRCPEGEGHRVQAADISKEVTR